MSILEQQVRSLDDESKSIKVSARDMAAQLGTKFGTTRAYLIAKRNGFASSFEYYSCNARKNGFKDRNDLMLTGLKARGFNSFRQYRNWLALSRGFVNWLEYCEFKRNGKKGENLEEYQAYIQKKEDEQFFGNQLIILPNEKLPEIPIENNIEYLQEEIEKILGDAMSVLAEREMAVIKNRFYKDQFLEKIGESFRKKISKERVRQIEAEALEKMRRYLEVKHPEYF